MKVTKTIHSEEYHVLTSWLRSCREAKKLTIRALGEKLGVNHTIVTKIENNERRLDVIEYIRYCDALEIDPLKGMRLVLGGK